MLDLYSVLLAFIVLALVLAPFALGEGGSLAQGSAINDLNTLQNMQKSILKRFLQEEKAQKEGHITLNIWNKRRQYLTNRYIDCVRRLDAVKGQKNA